MHATLFKTKEANKEDNPVANKESQDRLDDPMSPKGLPREQGFEDIDRIFFGMMFVVNTGNNFMVTFFSF